MSEIFASRNFCESLCSTFRGNLFLQIKICKNFWH